MDEISTGLDSSTTFQIIKFLRDTTHFLSYTTLIALLQPAPETYDLFDDVLLISSGAQRIGLGAQGSSPATRHERCVGPRAVACSLVFLQT